MGAPLLVEFFHSLPEEAVRDTPDLPASRQVFNLRWVASLSRAQQLERCVVVVREEFRVIADAPTGDSLDPFGSGDVLTSAFSARIPRL